MKPYNERLPLIDAAIDKLNGVWPFEEDVATTDSVDCGVIQTSIVCTRQEFEQRAKELGYPKEQDINNDWYEKGEKPPVGAVVEVFDCHAQLIHWNGKHVEVVKNVKSPDGERLTIILLDECIDATLINTKKLRPLRTETDKLVEQAISDAEKHTSLISTSTVESLIKAGYRKIKPMSEDEFMKRCVEICESDDTSLYEAGCRFIDKE